jgi:lipoate---protein ligase
MTWPVQHVTGTVRELHGRSELVTGGPAAPVERAVRILHPVDRALVLGSTQADSCADSVACAAAGTEVVRRRSGGGAVLVQPGAMAWVDLFVPAGDALWLPDVSRAAWWVGEAWARALAASGLFGLDVWKEPMARRPWSSLVCFAGRAAGEVTGPAEAKIVGVCQRRSRAGAWFQCACLLRWEPGALVALMMLSPADRAEALDALDGVAFGAGEGTGEAVVGHLLGELP